MQEHGEASDQDVPDAFGVQRPAEPDDVLELRCA
jgi:hypothetical protein